MLRLVINELRDMQLSSSDRSVPITLRNIFRKACEVYVESDETGRSAMRESAPLSGARSLLGLSVRMAISAARENSYELLFQSLMVHAFEDFKYDARESIILLSIIERVASRFDGGSKALLTKILPLCSERAASHMSEFFRRTERLKSLDGFGLIEVETPDGIDYRVKE